MSHQAIPARARMPRGHVGLGKAHLETLCMRVVA